ncbi:MAG: CaiB/BaiF CoA transferase family protein [Roseobacter sp.]
MGALDGLLVLTLEQAVAAPLCTVRLADAGARVIKIERSEGETARHYDYGVEGTCSYFAWLNRGKESAVLDLKTPPDFALFCRMLARADVLVQNLAPGAMNRMGLGADVLRRDYPQLISVSICGYGSDTPYAQMKAYDLLVQAESGICAVTGTPEAPSKAGVPIADLATGANAHAAVLEALIERGITGQGKTIEVTMFDSLADWMAVPFLHREHMGRETGRHGMAHATVYPYRPYPCSDGAVLIAVQNNAQWARLCLKVLNEPDLHARADLATNDQRIQNRADVDAALEPLFAAMTTDEATQKCEAGGIAWARYRSVTEFADHPALRRVSVPLENGGCADIPRPAGRDSTFLAGPLPALGAHTQKVRDEFG